MFRSIEIVIPSDREIDAQKVLEDLNVLDFHSFRLSRSKTRFDIITRVEKTQEVLDVLQNAFSSVEGFNVVLKHVDAYFPAPAEEKGAKLPSIFDIKKERISREEINRTVLEMTNLTSIYLLMVILSSLVAAVGIILNNVALIIAAMIIAPLLGPGIGLSYGLAMGDRSFVLMALKTSIVGVLIGVVIAVFLGLFVAVDPTIPSIITRTTAGKGGFIVALASGFA